MSAVTAAEIAQLTAAVWNVPLESLSGPVNSRPQQPSHQFDDPANAARACAMMLIRKHTQAGCQATTRALGREIRNLPYVEKVIDRFGKYAARRPEVQRRIEAIEGRIDDIHEARVDTPRVAAVFRDAELFEKSQQFRPFS